MNFTDKTAIVTGGSRGIGFTIAKALCEAGTNVMTSIGDYFTKMLDNSLDWKDVEDINKYWGKQFAIKGIIIATNQATLKVNIANAVPIFSYFLIALISLPLLK